MIKAAQSIGHFVAPPEGDINLAMNENHLLNWHAVLDEQLDTVGKSFAYQSYGTSTYTALTDAYAKYAKIDPDEILVAAGSESIIPLLFTSLAEKKIMTVEPDFFRYDEYARLHHLEQIKVPIMQSWDVEEIITTIQREQVELFIFSQPNNPLGRACQQQDIYAILEQTAAYVVVDEAYFEFYGQTMIHDVKKYKKLIVMRTMSKAWALAGLRLGFAVAAKELIHALQLIQGPFSVSELTAQLAAKALAHESLMKQYCKEMCDMREAWRALLRDTYNLQVYPSATNFLYVETDHAKHLQWFLAENKLHITFFAPRGLRISIGNKAEMDVLARLLQRYFC